MTTPQFNPYAHPQHQTQPQPPQYNPYAAQPGGYAGAYGGQVSCRFCGTAPAADVTFRAHRGLLVLMTFRKLEGPMCHSCGMQVYRKMTTETLWQGWWSPASLVVFTPFTLLWNVIAAGKVKKLRTAGAAR
ncbi:hypothetical protein AB0C59_14090 [Streptomyces sp. NPDC048664]|uniref:hypothetical protein n=1 Tax=Streptomyces sp. NPDC048664 TaxID=3154505 RepID=UPI003420BD94